MQNVESVQTFDQIKLLADPRRMEILRLLMAAPSTLTQLARRLRQSPAWIRHHIKLLEAAKLVEIAETRTTGTVTEKYYRARAGAFLLQEIILPRIKKPAVIFSGSHDLAMDRIGEHLQRHLRMLSMPVGSLDGLVNLRQGLCQISGSHLLDQSGEYNTPFIRHLFPDREVEVITLAYRTQGWILANGNPRGIKKISDLANPAVRFVNCNLGSGTRLWFDTELRKYNLPADQIHGYNHVVKTHSEASALIASRRADAALGLQAAAYLHELDFIPLFEERYDLVLPREQQKRLTPLLDYLQTSAFRQKLDLLSGYSTVHSGEQISLD